MSHHQPDHTHGGGHSQPQPVKKGAYHLLKCRVLEGKFGPETNDHYQIRVTDNHNEYRVAVNAKSTAGKPDLYFLADHNFRHPITALLEARPGGVSWGFTPLRSGPGGLALDYIRDNLFDYHQMRIVPENAPNPANSLYHQIDTWIELAKSQPGAVLYAWGMRWQDDPRHPGPQYFDKPILVGIHDIHMNQGDDDPQYVSQNGVWQDGALIIHLPAEQRWVALFFAFQSQCFHTDDVHGNCLHNLPPGIPVPKWQGQGAGHPQVKIVAALVNPRGSDPGQESVTLLNTSSQAVELEGWQLADRNKQKEVLAKQTLAPGQTTRIKLSGQGAQLSNQGGIISLLNPAGIKIDGVAYTAQQAQSEGRTLTF
jgi:uncharacterized protein YukJ